jgi:ADP-ribosylglycohydrolase
VKKQGDLAVSVKVTHDKLDQLKDQTAVLADIVSNMERGRNAKLELQLEKYEEEKRKHEEMIKELQEEGRRTEGQSSWSTNTEISLKLI